MGKNVIYFDCGDTLSISEYQARARGSTARHESEAGRFEAKPHDVNSAGLAILLLGSLLLASRKDHAPKFHSREKIQGDAFVDSHLHGAVIDGILQVGVAAAPCLRFVIANTW